MDLLIVEDEPKVAAYLKSSLEAEGHTVRCCQGVEDVEAQFSLSAGGPEIVVLDRMLRGDDGMALVPRIKQRYPGCRVLILSAIDLAEEKARALDLGADDYLCKPFSMTELSARLRVLARRISEPSFQHLIQNGNLAVDLSSQLVSVGGRRIDLSKKEYQVLVVLLQYPGRVFNKFQLLDKVWDMQVSIESNTVEVTIKNLRRKLVDVGSNIQILSRRNVGYWIES